MYALGLHGPTRCLHPVSFPPAVLSNDPVDPFKLMIPAPRIVRRTACGRYARSTNTILHWVSLGRGQGVYELRAGDEVVGTLRRVKLPGSLCVLDTADGTGHVNAAATLEAAVTVRVAGEETNYAFSLITGLPPVARPGQCRKFRWHAAHRRQRF